jgi:hypothetical protein
MSQIPKTWTFWDDKTTASTGSSFVTMTGRSFSALVSPDSAELDRQCPAGTVER